MLESLRPLTRAAALASLAVALGCGPCTHLTRNGDLWISGRVLLPDRELPNLTLVRVERAGPVVEISRDPSAGSQNRIASLAVRNFGLEKTVESAEVELFVDGRPAGSWTIAAPIRSGEIVRNPSIPIGPFASGAHELRVVIDPANRVRESMKSDNEYRTTVTLPND